MRKDETPVKKREFSLLLRGGLTIGAAVAVVLLWPQLRPLTVALLQKAALFTTVLDMPGGALETLRERYADQLLPEEPQPVPQPVDEVPEPANEEPPAAAAPEIPEEYRGKITELTMTGDDSPAYIAWKGIRLRNYTGLTAAEVEKVLAAPSRVAVGAVLASGLEEAGLKVLHDDTQHDNPAYTGAYQRSNATVKGYQKQYPHLQVLLDIHRDAILYSDTNIAKTVAWVDGKKAAQLMIIAPYDSGTLGIPRWRENLRFAVALAGAIEERYPGLCRPIFFCSRAYTFACGDGDLLLEFGTNGNTMEEAQYTARLIAPILAEVLTAGQE